MINALPAHGGSHGCQRLSCLRYVTRPLRWFVHRALTCTCALGVIAGIERRLPSHSSTTSPSSCLILTLEKMRGEGKADREDQSLSCSQRPMCEGSWPTMWTRQSECHPPRQRPPPRSLHRAICRSSVCAGEPLGAWKGGQTSRQMPLLSAGEGTLIERTASPGRSGAIHSSEAE